MSERSRSCGARKANTLCMHFQNLLKDKESATFVILGPDFPASIKKIQKEKLSCIGFGIVFKEALSFPRRPHLSLALSLLPEDWKLGQGI